MLTTPALGREIEGDASVYSASGQTIEFYVNTAAPFYAVRAFSRLIESRGIPESAWF